MARKTKMSLVMSKVRAGKKITGTDKKLLQRNAARARRAKK